jgi:hypothetical protein
VPPTVLCMTYNPVTEVTNQFCHEYGPEHTGATRILLTSRRMIAETTHLVMGAL